MKKTYITPEYRVDHFNDYLNFLLKTKLNRWSDYRAELLQIRRWNQ